MVIELARCSVGRVREMLPIATLIRTYRKLNRTYSAFCSVYLTVPIYANMCRGLAAGYRDNNIYFHTHTALAVAIKIKTLVFGRLISFRIYGNVKTAFTLIVKF